MENKRQIEKENSVLRVDVSRPEQNILTLSKFIRLVVSASHIKKNFGVCVRIEATQTVFVHLDCVHILFLLHIYVSDIDPHIGEVSG